MCGGVILPSGAPPHRACRRVALPAKSLVSCIFGAASWHSPSQSANSVPSHYNLICDAELRTQTHFGR